MSSAPLAATHPEIGGDALAEQGTALTAHIDGLCALGIADTLGRLRNWATAWTRLDTMNARGPTCAQP